MESGGPSLAVHFSEHDIDRADDGDHVRNQRALRHFPNACRLIKDGGRTRTRYGCVVPSLTM